MATLLLSAAGAAIGGSFGGTVAGLTAGALGKAVGATVGAVIDQRLTGLGSEPVETGRVERFRVMGASEGAVLPRVFGRFRVAGQVIWSSGFLESANSRRVGGKGGGQQSQSVREFRYSISLAIAICEGEVTRVGRVWADGQRVDLSGVTWRVHAGGEDQLPDPVISALEGVDAAPAYRGVAYVLFENLDLTPYGNRIPQFNFEVFRRPEITGPGIPRAPALDIRGVALVPGTGEYALATTPVYISHGKGRMVAANVNNDRGRADLVVSLAQLRLELPAVDSVSLVVSWFGDDLRCDRCTLQPAVEQAEKDSQQMPWRVSGSGRFEAKVVSRVDDRPLFGGTPSDASVLQAIKYVRAAGQSVMFYPFILMDVLAGNTLRDPWTGADSQPSVPWRGGITLASAPGRAGSSDKTAAAAGEVAAFFGSARVSDFRIEGGEVVYDGPAEWSYRRFILHYAHLCALSGGVDSFCIGSEMRSLTQARDSVDGFPAVGALCTLAEDVRLVLGPDVRIGYAADWSEYFGYQPGDGSGDVLFHLDPLWSHSAIDFVGIDNYMPISDWRDGSGHLDAEAGSIYDLAYLVRNVAGGEGYEWFYADRSARDRQVRTPIADGAYGEDWVFRYKDIASWWSRPHVNRIGGVKASTATSWRPRSKPIWFTELGCPAVEKGTNQPNVFVDPKSSESSLPYFSNGSSDDFIQRRYLQAIFAFWGDLKNNPISDIYNGRMVAMDRAHVWAWDGRPWPDFPERLETWADGPNYDRGHWLNARVGLPSLAEIVAEVCARSGIPNVDVSDLHGGATGYLIGGVESARQSLQPLMLTYSFDSFSAGEMLAFSGRSGRVVAELSPGAMVTSSSGATISYTRIAPPEAAGATCIEFVRSDLDYQAGVAEAIAPQLREPDTSYSSVPLVLSEGQARVVSERWLAEGQVARDTVQFEMPLARLAVTPGDVLSIRGVDSSALYRVDRVDELGGRSVTAVRIEAAVYDAPLGEPTTERRRPMAVLSPVFAEFLDLPLLTGGEDPQAPHVAIAKTPWAGSVAVYSATDDYGYALDREVSHPGMMGETLDPLGPAISGLWTGGSIRVLLATGVLQSREASEVLNGANAAAVRYAGTGDWEVIQFASATLLGPGEYRLSRLLRGQAGTDGIMSQVLPAGSDFVLLDAGVVQLQDFRGARGLERHYRIGPAVRDYSDPSYLHTIQTFSGVGLRPLRPEHLVARRLPDAGIELRWIRRTRVDGDSWEGADVPVGEERELYHVLVKQGDRVVRRYETSSPIQVYNLTDQIADEASGPLTFGVAQVSSQFGPGPYAAFNLDG